MTKAFGLLFLSLLLAGCSNGEFDASARRGRDHMQYYGCSSCHTIPGVPGAHATVGPPLDHMGVRTYIAGTLPNSPQHLVQWIRYPQQIRPDTAMPELGVTAGDAEDITRYLEDLR